MVPSQHSRGWGRRFQISLSQKKPANKKGINASCLPNTSHYQTFLGTKQAKMEKSFPISFLQLSKKRKIS
jgi:hypothetical protein